MAKESAIKFKGMVTEVLPSTMFKVTLSENNHVVTCTLSGRMRTNNIKILLHDDVEIEMSPYDLEKGRIIYRF
jgi:translation initiation factor IF-1